MNEVYEKISKAANLIDEIDQMISTHSERLQKVDHELSDWLHYIENNDLSSADSVKIVAKIKELRLLRKELHREHAIEKAYMDNSSKMMGNNTRGILMANINKAVNDWENEYKNRVLTDEMISEVLNETKKRGRPRKIDLIEEL